MNFLMKLFHKHHYVIDMAGPEFYNHGRRFEREYVYHFICDKCGQKLSIPSSYIKEWLAEISEKQRVQRVIGKAVNYTSEEIVLTDEITLTHECIATLHSGTHVGELIDKMKKEGIDLTGLRGEAHG